MQDTQSDSLAGLRPLAKRLLGLSGQFVGVSWARPVKTYKGLTDTVTKHVRSTVRVGLDYDKREVVKDARESGEAPAENAGLPWGKWLRFPYVIEHKGGLYVRLYPVRDGDGNPRACKVIYRLNGQRVPKSALDGIALASELTTNDRPTDCYTLGQQNLTQVRLARPRLAG